MPDRSGMSGGITHKKVSARADGTDTIKVQPSNWNDVHAITGDVPFAGNKITGLADPVNPQDGATKAYVDAHAGGGSGTITGVTAGSGLTGGGITGAVALSLSDTTVTPGTYTNTTLTVDQKGRVTSVSSGSGGGGITNGAGSNVIMKSNGTNAIASGISDDGTIVGMSARKFQVGPTAVPTLNKAFFSLCDATTTTQLFIQETDTNHTGQTGVNNEAICLVVDQRATFNTTADAVSASANGITILVSSTRVAGTKPLINDGLIISVGGGDTNRAIYIPPGGGIISAGDGMLSGPLTVAGDSSFSGGKIVATFTAGSSISLTGNITATGSLTGGSAHITGNIKGDQEFIIDPSGTHAYFYVANATSGSTVNNLNISSAGAGGKIIFQGNNVGSNSGTGGIEVWGGNNGGTAKGGITGAGVSWGVSLAVGSASGPKFTTGTVAPNGAVVGSVGDKYINTAGTAGGVEFTKTSGTATNTGWTAIA